jgi:hypothetical protein
MPWKESDAPKKNKKAKSRRCKHAFAGASNSIFRKTGDEGRAVRGGNAAVNKCNAKSKRKKRRSVKR